MGAAMVSFIDFRRLAMQCQQKSLKAHDRQAKAIWRRMAKRWMICADLAESEYKATVHVYGEDKHRSRPNKHADLWNPNDAGKNSRMPSERIRLSIKARS